MGICFSGRSSYSFNNIRVVHLNGHVEDFDTPVTVSQITGLGKPPKHFVCTPAQLLTACSERLKPHMQLEPGHIYLLLPYSAFQSDVSPVNLAVLARKLTAAAKTKNPRTSPLSNHHTSSPVWSFPGKSPNRLMDHVQKSPKAQSWRPLLETIREISFNRGSESDLREKHTEIPA